VSERPSHPAILAWIAGMMFAAVVIVAYGHGHIDRMTSGDGYFYRYVAQHLDASKGQVAPIVAARGPALRYGRIALPALIWLLSGGRSGLMRYVQPVIMVLAAGAIAASARTLLKARGLWLLLPFVSLGLTLSIAGGYAEAISVAFLLAAAVEATNERWLVMAMLCALAMLSRENSALVVLGFVGWVGSRKGWRIAFVTATSFVPVTLWHLVVWNRFGHLPLLDPYVAHGAQVSKVPFLSLWRGLTRYGLEAFAIAAVHIVLWIVAFGVRRGRMLGWLAVAAGLQLAAIPLLNWHYAGDNLRLLSMMEVFTVLAIAAWTLSRRRALAGEAR